MGIGKVGGFLSAHVPGHEARALQELLGCVLVDGVY